MNTGSRDPRGERRRRATLKERGRGFRASRFFPASVVVAIIAVAAGLFAGSYTYSMANPTPRDVPVALVNPDIHATLAGAFIKGMDQALDSSLRPRIFRSYGAARDSVEQQKSFAIISPLAGNRVLLDTSSASGASVAEVLETAAPRVGAQLGAEVTVRDLKPLGRGDPRGLAIFYISLAAVVLGFVGATQLGVHASDLRPPERIVVTAVLALLGGFAIQAVVGWWLRAARLPFPQSWAILALTMFASGLVYTMFKTLFGSRWAMIPTWGLMIILGNPSSGGAVSWPLLPQPLGAIGRWLPPGASVNAQHNAVYFSGHQMVMPYLVLSGWAVVSGAVFWIYRDRYEGTPSRSTSGRRSGTQAGP
ncbi:ABC transporter permease [Streptomyces bauhiniae]|uniref:ABC transporter permease n=1 Tax=Streptomyces bauhiniae TaxID=2340725 RepID=A0A7K3QUB8_9ACTN|nr:ABC transporter permease [Streptomyces bauhiniae]NEB93509.1 ABC transporter permease [Streptomyces bauhiniae]